ncbi:MAG: bifunctional adenosylcobinamide kinase/adenosylcobinamide-phosphate guanylyltransferase [Treponema sp.]|nr:bifunctional adenosylcobinamide kinase/adenosylcobinamide-phosphate guanylyltransferase [Treponema sp.]
MILIIGGYASGKHEYARCELKTDENNIFTVTDVIVSDYEKKPDAIFNIICNHKIVIVTEIGNGVIPVSAKERTHREASGQLAIRLAKQADAVIRMVCGIPQIIKGKIENGEAVVVS